MEWRTCVDPLHEVNNCSKWQDDVVWYISDKKNLQL